jgi:histidine triad (HIT) family protein
MDCIFCKIAKGEIPSQIVYEDSKVMAFKDINPQAPVHIVIIPKEHIKSIMDINEDNCDLMSHIILAVKTITKKMNIADTGFRLLTNTGKDGGQEVLHLHFHLLGGRSMQWPPG